MVVPVSPLSFNKRGLGSLDLEAKDRVHDLTPKRPNWGAPAEIEQQNSVAAVLETGQSGRACVCRS